MNNKHLIVLLGPTGVGKTELSLSLAGQLNTSIISCDSRQFYKDLKIGTAAPSAEQLERIPHHFIGMLELNEYYNAAKFETDVIELLAELFVENDVALMTGGSMMYIDAVCKGIDDLPTVDAELRNELLQIYEREGLEPLRAQLKMLDPVHYAVIDLKNPKRVLHALEICLMTGKPYSSLRKNKAKERPFNHIKIGLKREREELYERINKRVDEMMQAGLLEEVKSLYAHKSLNSLNTVGYKELFSHLDGNLSLEEAIEKIKQNTRIYSRKQMTWFRRDENIRWFHPDEQEEILRFLNSELTAK